VIPVIVKCVEKKEIFMEKERESSYIDHGSMPLLFALPAERKKSRQEEPAP